MFAAFILDYYQYVEATCCLIDNVGDSFETVYGRKLNTVLRDNVKPYTIATCLKHVEYCNCLEIQVAPQVVGRFISFLVNY
jgi:hypothetical protein